MPSFLPLIFIPVYAYLDPGTGGYILQLLIVLLVGTLFAVRAFWANIAIHLSRGGKVFLKEMVRPFIIHPFLFALFPVLDLFSRGVGYIPFWETLLPTAIVLIFTFLLLLGARAIFKDSKKAGLAISAFLILFFSYGSVHYGMHEHGMFGSVVIRSLILLIAWGALFIVAAYVVAKIQSQSSLHNLTRIFNIMGITLILISSVRTATQEIRIIARAQAPRADIEIETHGSGSGRAKSLPDIYYIIFDTYADADTLKNVYGYDNSEFLEYLTGKGFYVASKSYANYAKTVLSLASSLNMEYIDFPPDMIGEAPLHHMIKDNRVWRFLKSRGYKYIHLGAWYEATRRNKFADINYNYGLLPEFSMILYKTTMLYPIGAKFGILDTHAEHWRRIPYKFKKMAEMPAMEGPKFIFAHMIIPHDPYVFDSDGSYITREEAEKRDKKELYLNQVIFINEKVKPLVNKILSESDPRPIIIIQSDEGPVPLEYSRRSFKWATATTEELKEKTGILNVYYLPGVDKDVLYPEITPVNTFRLIFNSYFDADLELLPDKIYGLARNSHLYKFIDITERVRGK